MSWTIIVIIVCLLLALLLMWMEYRRPNSLRLPLRLTAVLLAVIALACIALPVSYQSKTVTGINDGVLLTDGFNPDSLSRYQNSKLFTTETTLQKADPKLKITLLADLSDIAAHKLNMANLHVLGYGLNGDELKQLNHTPISFRPSAIPSGITAINWNRTVKAGEPLYIQGKFTGTQPKVSIILKGLNTGLDSVIINSGSAFALKTIPKNTGRATYTLLVINDKDTIEKESIPFQVEPAKPIKVLMLSTSPDFENKFLKNWLSQQGYGVALRTAISKEKFSREYLNLPQINIDHVTPALLERFDLIIGDLSSFKSLTLAENGAIQQQMAQKGLGVIVKADSTGKGASFLANIFPMDRLSDKNQKSVSLSFAGQNTPSAKLTLDAVFIKPQPNTQPLVLDEQSHIIASSTIYGSGKIVFSTLGNTFNWVLSGNNDDYTSLWSILISKAARKSPEAQKWNTSPALPVVNHPVTLTVDGLSTLPLQIKAGTSMVAFAQHPLLPFSWSTTYWPAAYGWQPVTQNGNPVFWWYAFQNSEWIAQRATATVAATQKYATENAGKSNSATAQQNNVSIPVSKIWFYLLLLFSCIYLWIERKL